MIDPKTFIRPSINNDKKYKNIDGTFTCSEPGCFETSNSGKYDYENKKVFWTCINGHECSARLVYE
jgi:hypothetical protein